MAAAAAWAAGSIVRPKASIRDKPWVASAVRAAAAWAAAAPVVCSVVVEGEAVRAVAKEAMVVEAVAAVLERVAAAWAAAEEGTTPTAERGHGTPWVAVALLEEQEADWVAAVRTRRRRKTKPWRVGPSGWRQRRL